MRVQPHGRLILLLAAAACFCAALLSGQAAIPLVGIKHVYVEPFPAKTGSEELRGDLIAQLRKMSFSIVATETAADLTISGNGETWIKGYRSLNPRSGRQPSNGQPVYAGYMSVEIRDRMGETLWSYLVTLGPDTGDIGKNLSKEIGKHLMEALK